MKKYIFLLILLIIVISACEKDDLCIQNPVTPNLILRFYDKDNTNKLKVVQRLSIIAQGKTDSLFTNKAVDSIAIPLNSSTQETIYTLKMNNIDNTIVNNKIAKLTIKYRPEYIYVSRSCGFKAVFKDVNLEFTG